MIEFQMLRAWIDTRLVAIRDRRGGEDAGFTTLEWVAITGVVIVAAIVIATVLMNKAKDAANSVNVQ